METVFLKILNMSITACWLVLAVLLMRLLFKKAPRYLRVIMWALVGIRLLLPFTFESALSLIPSAETVPPEIIYEEAPEIHTDLPAFDSTANPVISKPLAPDPESSVNPMQLITRLAGWIWIAGMAGMVIYTLISCLRIRRKLREATLFHDNVFLCDRITTPFIFGLFRPRIYLPSGMDPADVPYVLAHEQAHLKRRDHLWKPLGFLLLAVHWFNPFLWLAYILLCRDIEAACDEKVLKDKGEEIKKPYSRALVNCSVPRKMIAACPLAFGEVGVKSRIKNVLNYKKPAFWLLITAVIACIVLCVCFLTNPRTVDEKMQIFLDCQIAEHHQSEKSEGRACCVDYEILGTKQRGKTTTVYMWVLYEEYSYENGQLQNEVGAHIPTVITAQKEDGNYRLTEYWEPRDGSYYAEDIKDKFPWYLQRKASDSQRYIEEQKANCLEMAEQYFKENPPTIPPTASSQEDLLWWDHPLWYHDQSLIDTATFDIDSDGTEEICQLHHGPTSGLFTFALTVFEGGQPEYCNIFMSAHGDLSFQQQSNGTLGIRLIPSTSFDELILYNIVFADGHIQLLNAGKPLEYWGPQGVAEQQTVYNLEKLRAQYPQYFDLPTDKGLEVCMWYEDGNVYCGLLAGRNLGYTTEDYETLEGVGMSQMRKIVASYGLDRDMIFLYPVQIHDYQDWWYADEKYFPEMEQLFWGGFSAENVPVFGFDDWGLRMHVQYHFDKTVTILYLHDASYATVSGELMTGYSFDIYALHEGEYIPYQEYVEDVLQQYYPDDQLVWPDAFKEIDWDAGYIQTDNHAVVTDTIPPGIYELRQSVKLQTDDGQEVWRTYSAPFEIADSEYHTNLLQSDYPQYFSLPTDEGLKVVAWQMAPGGWYSWGLLPGKEAEHTWEDYLDLAPVSLEDVRAIVESYELSPSQISVELIQMPYSSYFNPMLEQTQKSVESIFWGKLFIELTCCGNLMNTQIIDDPYICGSLSDLLFLAESYGQQSGSSKGYYGATYGIDIYWGSQTEPYRFTLWDQETFSVSTKKGSDGYEYLYKADLAELYSYLAENYPVERWYPEVYPDSLHQQYDITTSFAYGTNSGAIYAGALNSDQMPISSVRHLPIYKFDTLQQLQQFKQTFCRSSDVTLGEELSFDAATAKYDEAFFEENTLLLVYVSVGNCTHRFDVSSLYRNANTLHITVNETTGATEVQDTATAWFITAAVPDSTVKTCTQFDARME